jgi:hypothetical protein
VGGAVSAPVAGVASSGALLAELGELRGVEAFLVGFDAFVGVGVCVGRLGPLGEAVGR